MLETKLVGTKRWKGLLEALAPFGPFHWHRSILTSSGQQSLFMSQYWPESEPNPLDLMNTVSVFNSGYHMFSINNCRDREHMQKKHH